MFVFTALMIVIACIICVIYTDVRGAGRENFDKEFIEDYRDGVYTDYKLIYNNVVVEDIILDRVEYDYNVDEILKKVYITD